MQIVNVSVAERRRFVPVRGWDSVIAALTLFGNGYSRAAWKAEDDVLESIAESAGDLGALLFILGSPEAGKRSNLVDKLLLEAGQTLEYRPRFSRSYDYDGAGTPFMKTTVDINNIGDDMYCIGLNAAYVGDEPEAGLAEYLGIPRTLLSCTVEVETNPVAGNRFEFDFEPILRRLESVLNTRKITGMQVARAMMRHGDEVGVLTLDEIRGLCVRIQLGRVERRMKFDRRTGTERDTWSIDGRLLSGELRRDYGAENEDAKATPTLEIVVSSAQRSNWEADPIWKFEQQQAAILLAQRIARVLK